MRIFLGLTFAFLAGCGVAPVADGGVQLGDDGGTNAGLDAGADGGPGVGADSGVDAGTGAGTDSGTDAGTDTGADGGAGADAGQPASFTSAATCNTQPCQGGAVPNAGAIHTYPTPGSGCPVGPIPGTTNVIGLGAVSNGATTACRVYGYYRPANLVGKATAVFTAGGAGGSCGNGTVSFDGANWINVANANQLVLIFLSYCPSNAWTHPYIDVPAPPTVPSDGPYLAAVVNDAANNPNIGIDPTRLILTGGSSGGTLTWGTACDPTYSSLFKGYAPVSASMNVQVDGGAPVPGTFRCSSANKQFFLNYVHGTADMAVNYNGKCIASHCIPSFAWNEAFWSAYLGCDALPVKTPFGTPVAANTKDDYGNCGFGSPAQQLEAVTVADGGHQHGGLDAVNGNPTNGFNTAQTNWDFFSTRRWLE